MAPTNPPIEPSLRSNAPAGWHQLPDNRRVSRYWDGAQWAQGGPEVPTQTTRDRSAIEESLRRLKALHDDSILTDDEYEAKRQALADQL